MNKNSTLEQIQELLNKLPEQTQKLFVYDNAKSVLYIYEKEFPDDKRIRITLEILKQYLLFPGTVTEQQLIDARETAWSAAGYANSASSAAWSAAWYASWYASVRNAGWYATWSVIYTARAENDSEKWNWINNLYQNALPNTPIPLTPDICRLQEENRETENYAIIPILADALEDEGYSINRNSAYGLSSWILQRNTYPAKP